MLRLIPGILILFVLSIGMAQGQCVIARDHLAQSSIVVDEQSGKRHDAISGELQQILKEITGATLPIKTTSETGIGIILGTSDRFPRLAVKERIGELGPDGFLIRSEKNRIWILANTDHGLQNGVYAFLEDLGCRWYFADPVWTVIPSKPTLVVNTNRREKPAFDYRLMWYEAGAPNALLQQNYDAWMKHNRMYGAFTILCGHSYDSYIPKSEFTKHPEWFALVKGKRQDTQLCISNPEVQQQLISAVLNVFKNNPEQNMASMEPNDGGADVYCSCNQCAALGTQSDQVFTAANIVARAVSKEYPGKWVGLLVYADHSDPPSFKLEPNVFVMVTTMYNWTGISFEDQVLAFHKKGAKVGVYDYPSGIAWYWDKPGRCKLSKFYDLARDMRKYRDLGATTYDAQMSINWGVTGPGLWQASRLLWNPDADPKSMAQDFYNNAFQKAAGPMERIYERWASGEGLSRNFPKKAVPGVIEWEAQEAIRATSISRDSLKKAMLDLQQAYSLEDDPKVRARLDQIAMYLHWLRLDIDYDASIQQKMPDDILKQRAHDFMVYSRRIMDTGLIHSFPLLEIYWFDTRFEPLKKIKDFDFKATTDKWKAERTDIPSSAETQLYFADDLKW